MADQELPEVQPTATASGSGRAKQLVFLFMSAVVIAVVIFLLGVSVGRGVRSSEPPGAALDTGAAGDTTVAAGAPATPPPNPTDLNYHNALQGQPEAGRKAAPPPEPAAGTAGAPKAAEPPPPPPSAPSGEFSLQIAAFKTREAADRQLAQVKADYPASVLTLPVGTPSRFKVVVGPFKTMDEANRTIARLRKDGFDPMFRR